MFKYRAVIKYIYDGDTLSADVDLGFGIWARNMVFRLAGVDAPQPSTIPSGSPEGDKVKSFVIKRILNREVTIDTYKVKKGKYDHWNAEVFYTDPDTGEDVSLNKQLKDLGLAGEFKR